MWRRFFLGVLVVLYICFVAGQSPKVALRGKKIILKPGIDGRPGTILWKHNGNKVVEFNGREEQIYGTYENRVTVDWHTADLEISDLRLDDSGEYELEAEVNNKLFEKLDKLEVIEEITEASITCALNSGDDSTKSATLLCAAKPAHAQNLSTFTWTSHGKVEPGPQLKISLGGEHDDKEYVCNVSNLLSAKAATFTAKECNTDKSSTLLAAILGTVVVLLLIILVTLAVGLYICKRRRIACFDVESSKDKVQPHPEAGADKMSQENQPLMKDTPKGNGQSSESETVRVDDRPQKGVDELIGRFGGGGQKQTPAPQTPQKDLENDIDKHEETASLPASPHKLVEETNEANESSLLIAREPTTPAAQEPDQSDPAENDTDEYKDAASTPPSPRRESPPPPEPHSALASNDPAGLDKAENDTDEHDEVPSSPPSTRSESPPRPSDSEKDDKPDPDTETPPEMSSAPEQKEEEKKEEVNSPPAKVTPPVPLPRSGIATQKVTGEEEKEEANLGPMKGQSDLLGKGKTNESDESLNYEQKNSDTPEPAEESADTSHHDGDEEPDLYSDNTNASQESQHPAHEGEDDDKQEAKVNTSSEPDDSSNDEDESDTANKQSGPKEEKTDQ